MILLINNSTNGNKLSFIVQVRHTLQHLRIPFIETKRVDYDLLTKMKKKITGIILSGSPMMLQKDVLSQYSFDIYYMLNLDVPVLGICFGSQLLTIINGGTLKPLNHFVCDPLPTKIETDSFLFNNVKLYDKNEMYLKFCFSNLPVKPKRKSAIALASIMLDGKRTPIAFQYSDKVFCILGHPEIEAGTHIIYRNFYDFCTQRANA
ncbi:MAG: gamma-glutamyl-gamma-aminobutyrate hydrolase family protein [Bacteroidota bacterium]